MLNRNIFNFALPMNGKVKYSIFRFPFSAVLEYLLFVFLK